MTEDEAKTKACCGPPAVAASNYYRASVACDAPMHCIGSECMAWRRTGDVKTPASITEIAAHMREHDVGPLDATAATSRTTKHGYCGLAGATQ